MFKRGNFIKRRNFFEKFELWDIGFGFKEKYLKSSYYEVVGQEGNTLVRNVDPNSHYCNFTQFKTGTCPPYVSIEIISSNKMNVITRTRISLMQIVGNSGGTIEVVFIFLGLVYGAIYWRHNFLYENKVIWSLSEEEMDRYRRVTSHAINI